MSPTARRIVIPLVVAVLALSVVALMIRARVGDPAPVTPVTPAVTPETPTPTVDDTGASPAQPAPEAVVPEAPADAAPTAALTGLRAVAPDPATAGPSARPEPLGSLDPAVAEMQVEFTTNGAGITWIGFSDIFNTAEGRIKARAHRADASNPAPVREDHYVLVTPHVLDNKRIRAKIDSGVIPDAPVIAGLAANILEINGTTVNVLAFSKNDAGEEVWAWSATGPGRFETVIQNGDGTPVLRVERRFIMTGSYGLQLEHEFTNLTADLLRVRWTQFGPGDLTTDPYAYIDRRRSAFGYVMPERDPERRFVQSSTNDSDLLIERSKLLKKAEAGEFELWPNEASEDEGLELTWFASTNRYFGLAVLPVTDEAGHGDRLLPFERVLIEASYPPGVEKGSDEEQVLTYLQSATMPVPVGGSARLDVEIFAGPLDEDMLKEVPLYSAMRLDHLVLYQMSTFCAICTFQWLAHLLLGFLGLLHSVTGDWGLAIIGLVIVVRACLHPITKRSQISMQRFGKQMGDMKPELDKLNKKFGDDPKRMQAEQLRLMREKGINPLGMLGCLPMLLQTPIWIALYAGLYFSFDLRHEPAFYGIFQTLTGGSWAFLADLSAPDHCLWKFDEPIAGFAIWRNITGINLLPFLMGGLFFFQQKYMSPPPSPGASPDQLRQQKIMKIMMVVMFPLMLYSAPSGLTLYILTSSTIGIFESRYVRAHISAEDLTAKPKKAGPARAKPKDAQGRAFAAQLKRAQEKKRAKQRGPEKKFKKRK